MFKKSYVMSLVLALVLALTSVGFAIYTPIEVPPIEFPWAGQVAPLVFRVGASGYTFRGVAAAMSPSYYKNGNTMMPIRMLEAFGVVFVWDQATATATMSFGRNTVVLTIGSTNMIINGAVVPIIGANGLPMAPELAPPGRTMIPARFVSEKLGFVVNWANDGTITITPR